MDKEDKFYFDDACMKSFKCLKEKLIFTLVIINLDWSQPFEVMCVARGTALVVVLGQKCTKLSHQIYYASNILLKAPCNYIITEQEILAVIYSCDKFLAYLLGTKVLVHTDNQALQYLMANKYAKIRFARWLLLRI